jgi:hypothetical protein
MVLASDYRVADPDRVWPLLQRRRSALADIGAHHVLVYKATDDYGRVLVTIGVRSREPIVELLRSRVFFDWFDAVGVDDIPAVFAGEIIERVGSAASSAPTTPGVVLAAIAAVDDVPTLVADIRAALPRLEAAGIRETRIFRAFDDAHEVLILQEIDDEDRARRWIEHPDVVAQWLTRAGEGAYPPLFVGRFVDLMRIDG